MKYLILFTLLAGSVMADQGFTSIFNGKTLDGWTAPDMSYWSVKDGAITATSSEAHPCKKNQFLVWDQGQLDDFELKLMFRIQGGPRANAGVQVRSAIMEDGHAVGYQADIDRAGKWLGALYDEHTGRKLLAARGQKTVMAEDGSRITEDVSDPAALMAKVDLEGWNEYHILAKGSHIVLKINGMTTAEVIDRDAKGRDLQGALALQLHSGPPMTMQYKDIRLKRTPLTDGRKKIVLIAGAPSHASGDHEHNAGIKLLTKRLQVLPGIIAANYHDAGWPKDPTAFDNADGVVMYMDGGPRHVLNTHLDEMDAILGKSGGLMCIHYAVEIPVGKSGDLFRKWIGGHYESGWSINPHWTLADTKLAGHPITRGIQPFFIKDEWYFNMRFREGMEGVAPILQARPDDEARSGSSSWPRGPKKHIVDASGRMETLMWAAERAGGGRGVGFTGGHFHKNWANDQQRNLVLNGILWMSGAEVPEGGIQSAPVDEEEINAHLDPKKKMKRITL